MPETNVCLHSAIRINPDPLPTAALVPVLCHRCRRPLQVLQYDPQPSTYGALGCTVCAEYSWFWLSPSHP